MSVDDTMHRLIWDLQGTTAVDPDEFREVCIELEVWEEGEPADLIDWMFETFDDSGMSAARRFVDLQICLSDGTLTEFMFSTDDGQVGMPNAIFEAAAVCPMDGESGEIDRPELRREITRRLED